MGSAFRRLGLLGIGACCCALLFGCGGKESSAFEKQLIQAMRPLTTESVAWEGELDGGYRGLVLRGRDNAALDRAVRKFLIAQGRREQNGFQYTGATEPGLVDVNVLPRDLSLVPSDAPDEAKRTEPGIMVSFSN